MTISKDKLLKAGELDTQTVEIPGVGDVEIRGLTRKQALAVADESKTERREALIVSYGLVEPSLTAREAQEWFKSVPAGLVQPLTLAISDLSGLSEGAEKTQVEEFPE